MESPLNYDPIESTTWAYMSSLLLVALFFKFNRFWSIRNLDLLLIVLLAPGLLMVTAGKDWVSKNVSSDEQDVALVTEPEAETLAQDAGLVTVTQPSTDDSDTEASQAAVNSNGPVAGDTEPEILPLPTVPVRDQLLPEPDALTIDTVGHRWQKFGYLWLFSVGLLFLIRLLLDPVIARRPVLEPNLSQGGLFFFAACLIAFLTINVILSEPTEEDVRGAKAAIKLLQREAAEPGDKELLSRRGPGYSIFYVMPIVPMFEDGNEILRTDAEGEINVGRYIVAAKVLAIISQVLIVLGLILFCYFNYDNLGVGVGTAAIYLMLPYTAMFTGHVLHTLPAALLLWSLVCFRRPWLSGILVGLAAGVAYYPVFLLPLWASFYWDRGVRRFLLGVIGAILICVCGLIFTSADGADFLTQLQAMFGFWSPRMDGLEGIWALGWSRWWRLPILVAFVAFCVSLVAWPNEKNLGTLVGYTGAIMVAVQFWHGFGGGLHVAWYLPMLLLIVFRPNLRGRIAALELRDTKKRKSESAEDFLPAA